MNNSATNLGSLELAAYGWSPANWLTAFYPDDLPEDWQVSYYANEFSHILIPADEWRQPLSQAVFWRQEVSPDFGFYLELDRELLNSEHWSQVQQVIEQKLVKQVRGLLVTADISAAIPTNWQGLFPLHVLPPGQWLAQMPDDANTQVGLLRSSEKLSPQELRGIFEYLQQHSGHPDVLLFVDAPWITLEQLRLMQQLYGV